MELMYITNRTDIASIAQEAGVDRIFVDMEYIGKELRQGGLDTVQSHHTIEDVKAIRSVLTSSKLLVRCNPIHGATKDYLSSAREIDEIVKAGADIIMLPYFKTVREVKLFIDLVAGRTKTCILLETSEAQDIIDEILELRGIDEVYIGLNDLHLSKNMTFMFELLADGTVETLTKKFRKKGVKYGFGGVARIGTGTLPAECILGEHYRLGSGAVILSRAFCDVSKEPSIESVAQKLKTGVQEIREYENILATWTDEQFEANRVRTVECTKKVVNIINSKK